VSSIACSFVVVDGGAMRSDTTMPRCLAIVGPTACGKTRLALELAREFPLEIVSMDSAQVYRGMDIGTAKPEPSVRSLLPHHLIDIRDPEEAYSAGEFAADAAHCIADIAARGRLALVVGGTMLYLKALREGIAALPPRNPAVRAAIDAEAERLGWAALHGRLAAIDPDAARRIEPGDRQRIQRALEVHMLTGRPISELQLEAAAPAVAVETVALIPADRAAHSQAIERRFQAMVEGGFVEEVQSLRRRPHLTADSASMRAVGYRQIWAFLEGSLEWDDAVRRAVIATRQLAKRQLTWLRSDLRALRVQAEDEQLGQRLRQRVSQMLAGA
jgi:tRNA dimethylallyltransferase